MKMKGDLKTTKRGITKMKEKHLINATNNSKEIFK